MVSPTTIGTFVPIGAAIIAGGCSIYTAISASYIKSRLDRQSQMDLRNEERSFKSRFEYVTPFLEILLDVRRYGAKVSIAMANISESKYPVNIRRELINQDADLGQWIESLGDLNRLQAKVAIVIEDREVSIFLSKTRALREAQVQALNTVLGEWTDTTFSDFKKIYVDFCNKLIDLFFDIRRIVRNESRTTPSCVNIEEMMTWATASSASFNFDMAESLYSFNAVWRLPKSQEPPNFKSEFNKLQNYLKQDLNGLIDHNVYLIDDTDNDIQYYVIKLEFSSKTSFDKFVEELPRVKEQSKLLWKGTNAPKIWCFAGTAG